MSRPANRKPARVDLRPAVSMVAGLLAITAPGCMVGPNYQPPEVAAPASFKSPPATRPTTGPALTEVPDQWWKLYGDPELERLVVAADIANQDIRQAVARVDQARALARVAASFLAPTVTADPSFTRTRTSADRPSVINGKPTGSATFNDWRIPFDLSYEVDVWGRVRRSLESARAQSRASAFDEAVIRLNIRTGVAQFYYGVRSLDAQQQILGRTVASYREQVRVVDAQLRNGLVNPTDLYQAQALLESTRAQQRDVERARANLEHALAILCGEPPPTFAIAPNPLTEPSAPAVPVPLPGQLLARRPDVAEAEQNVVAANAQVGVAIADFYPTFTLTGAAGFESASFQHLLDWQSRMLSIGPSVSFPIFEGGRLKANLEASKAQYRQLVAAYVKAVLVAYGDVEDALSDLSALTDETDSLRGAVSASQEYLRRATAQYRNGLVDYLVVIDAERTLLTNQLAFAQTVNQQTAASVHLIKALGGGWVTPE